eukprot:gene4670-9261_t
MSTVALVQVLQALMSQDNNVRKEAEAYYSGVLLETSLEQTILSLLQELSKTDQDIILRSFCGILLRRIMDRNGLYVQRISKGALTEIRSNLLSTWSRENNAVLLRRISHVIAQCASGGQWIDLIPLTVSQEGALSPDGKVSLLNLIEIIAEYCPDDILTHIKTLCGFLSSYIASTNTKIQVACAKTTAACIAASDDENARNALKPALQHIIDILGSALTRGEESDATAIMEYLVEVADIQPLFFKGVLDQVVSAMLTVASSTTLEFPTRSIALELIVTLTETAPALARRCPGLIQGMVPLAMAVMLEVDEEDYEWAQGPYGEENTDDNYIVGEESIERVATGLGGRIIAPLVFSAVEQFATSSEWRCRRAAVAALGRLAEGSTETFKAQLPTALNFLSSALDDVSPMVQFQAITAIGRFAHLYTEALSDMVPQFVPKLTVLLQTQGVCDRVRGHAVSALINLTNPEACSGELLQQHLDALLLALYACLQSASLSVQSPCMSLLGCVAQVAGDAFSSYYNSFMPGIKQILNVAQAPHLVELRGRAMEAVGLIGEAVGEDVFSNDAMEIMQLLLSGLCEDDTSFEYILPACARISKVLGSRFEPFLHVVITPVLVGATQEIKFSMEDADDAVDDDGEVEQDEETGLQTAIISLGGGVKKRVTLNTHAVQQKNQCARILYELASSLKGHLKSYLTPTLQALLPLITDKHSSDIRASASLAVATVFAAYLDAVAIGHASIADAQNALSSILNQLLQSIAGEVNSVSRACAAEAIRDVLLACYESGEESPDGGYSSPRCSLDLNTSIELSQHLLARCAESVTRRQEKTNAIAQNEGLDDEDRDACAVELEDEDDLLSNYSDALGQILKLHGESFMPTFEKLVVPALSPFLSPHQPDSLQVLATCMVDDLIEFGGKAALTYVPQSLQMFLRNLGSSHPILRQSSCYGIAQIARKAPELLVDQMNAVMALLLALINAPNARDEENEGTTENAIFAIGFICLNPTLRSAPAVAAHGLDQVVSVWLRNLPLRTDGLEAKTSSRLLCDAVECGESVIVGESYKNLPEILRVIADVLNATPTADNESDADLLLSSNHLAHPMTIKRMEQIVRQCFSSMSADAMNSIFDPMSDVQKNTLLRLK